MHSLTTCLYTQIIHVPPFKALNTRSKNLKKKRKRREKIEIEIEKCKMVNKEERTHEGNEEGKNDEVPLMALNHVSRLCSSVEKSVEFYSKVLGFVLTERPHGLDNVEGAWLFNYGIGIHLVQAKDDDKLPDDKDYLDPLDNHISFQCEDMDAVEQRLDEFEIKYIKRTVGNEEGAAIDQLFFNDPDGHMIEICNCEHLKLVPQRSVGRIKLPSDRHNPPVEMDRD